MNGIIKKIDEARNTLWMSRNKMYSGAIAETIDLLNEAEKLIQAEQKGPCEYCGSLAALYQISTNGHPDYQYYEPKYCPECGRPLNQKAEEE